MNTEQPGTTPIRAYPQFWKRMNRRWKMTLMGAAMGAFASGLWTAPAAYFALRDGYMTHGIIYVIASVIGIAGMAVIMHLLGIRQERVLNATD